MKKLIMSLVVLCGFAMGGAALLPTATAQAKTKYTIVAQRPNWGHPKFYHLANPKKSAILWNGTHTKKLGNLQKYPNTTWTSVYGHVLQHGKTKALYLRVRGVPSGNGRDTEAWVWHGYLKEGNSPTFYRMQYLAPSYRLTDKMYRQYIQKSPSQQLSRDVAKLFPATPISRELSAIADDNYTTNQSDSFVDTDDVTNPQNFTAVHNFKTINEYLYRHAQLSDKQKLAYIRKQLNKEGYTAKKRASLKGYQLGIAFINDLPDRHGTVMGDEASRVHAKHANSYGLVLAKPVHA